MPHLTLEYTDNLAGFDPAAALVAINAASHASGLFGEADIKSRAVALAHYRIGVKPLPRAFVHVTIALLAGRTSAERQDLAEAVLAALNATVDAPVGSELQLSVETVELDRPSYAKAVLHG